MKQNNKRGSSLVVKTRQDLRSKETISFREIKQRDTGNHYILTYNILRSFLLLLLLLYTFNTLLYDLPMNNTFDLINKGIQGVSDYICSSRNLMLLRIMSPRELLLLLNDVVKLCQNINFLTEYFFNYLVITQYCVTKLQNQ